MKRNIYWQTRTQFRHPTKYLFSCFIEQRVDENRSASQDSLLIGSGILGEINLKCVRISEHFGHDALGFLENDTLVLLSTLVANFGLENTKRLLAAALSTRVPLSAAVDAHSKTASGWVNEVQVVVLVVVDLERRNTEPYGYWLEKKLDRSSS